MADSVGVIGEALVATALVELGHRVFKPNSRFLKWADEISQPPDGLMIDGPDQFSGALFIVKNSIRRALLLEHRSAGPQRTVHRDGWGNPIRRPQSSSWEDTYGTEEDDGRLPSF